MKTSKLLITIALTGGVLVSAYFLYTYCYPLYGGGYGGYHMGRGMGFMMPLFWIILFVVVVSMLGRTTRVSGEYDRRLPDGPDALETLKQRYAKGEIDKAEFRAKLVDIRET